MAAYVFNLSLFEQYKHGGKVQEDLFAGNVTLGRHTSIKSILPICNILVSWNMSNEQKENTK